MTLGYNGNFLSANTQNSATVLDFAKDLLYDLKYAEDEDRHDLPIGDGNRSHSWNHPSDHIPSQLADLLRFSGQHYLACHKVYLEIAKARSPKG